MQNTRGAFVCATCSKVFTFKNNLQRHTLQFHTKIHTNGRYECNVCLHSFSTSSYLRKHIQIVHKRQGKVTCEICSKVFQSRNNLVGHLRYQHNSTQNPKEVFTCDRCKRTFNRKTNLLSHIVNRVCKEESNRARKPCPYCSGLFLDGSSIRTHLNTCRVKIYGVQCKNGLMKQKRRRKRKTPAQILSTKTDNDQKEKTGMNRKAEAQILSTETDNDQKEKTGMKRKAEAQLLPTKTDNAIQDAAVQDNNLVRRSTRKRKFVNYQLLNDPELFSDTVADNLAMEMPKNKEEPLVLNAKGGFNQVMVKIEEFIEEEETEECLVSDNGNIASHETNTDTNDESLKNNIFVKSEHVIIKTEDEHENESSRRFYELIGLV